MTIYEIEGIKLIEKAAEELKKLEQLKMPEWAKFVKTSAARERQPVKQDWWYVRAASILRKICMKGPIGVSKLRKDYGGRVRRGHKRKRVYPGSGKIIRVILQQLEKAEFIKQGEKSGHKGRVITSKGLKFLNSMSKELKSGKS
jgi:small subunit ribosomal protein S19e